MEIFRYKKTLEDLYISLLVTYIFLETISNGTGFQENVLAEIHTIAQVFWILFRILVCIKFILQFEPRDYGVIFLFFLAFFSSQNTSSYWISTIIWALLGTKYVDIFKVIRALFITKFFAVSLVILLCFIGIVDNKTIIDGGQLRQSLGFYHPNTFAAEILQLELMYVCIRDKKKKFNTFLLLIVSVWTYIISKSTTVIILSVCLIIYSYLSNNIYNINSSKNVIRKVYLFLLKKIKYLAILIPVFATIFIIYLSQDDGKGTLYARAQQAYNYLEYYGVSLFGKPLQINNSIDNFYLQNSKLYTLDNSYLYLLIGYGLICFILLISCIIALIYLESKKHEYTIMCVLIIYMIYGIVETTMIRFSYNFSLLFISLLIWGKSNRK